MQRHWQCTDQLSVAVDADFSFSLRNQFHWLIFMLSMFRCRPGKRVVRAIGDRKQPGPTVGYRPLRQKVKRLVVPAGKMVMSHRSPDRRSAAIAFPLASLRVTECGRTDGRLLQPKISTYLPT